MKAGIVIGLIVAAGVFIWTSAPADYETQRIAAEHAVALAPLDLALAAAWRLVPISAVVGTLVIAGRWAWLRVPYMRVGGEPVPLPDVREVAPAVLERNGAVQLAAAQRPNVPHTYSPHWSNRQEGARAAIEALDESDEAAPTLPNTIALSSVLPTLAPGKLCYGVLPGGDPLVLTFGQAYHALAAGDTRTGKSNYLDSTIVQLHRQANRYDLRLLIGDFKREMAATWRRSPLVETVETDPVVIADMLVSLAHGEDGILARYSEFERIGGEEGRVIRNIADWSRVTRRAPRLMFCVIDELNALIEAAEKRAELASALKVVLQTGAGAGVYVLGGAQYLTAKVFGRDGSKQFTTRALFGAYDQTAAGMIFGAGKLAPESRALLTGAPGRGLIRTAGQAAPSPFQALHCTEGDILEAVHSAGPGRAERAEPPRTARERAEPEFRDASEKAQIARRMRENGYGKEAIIKIVWNATKGGGPRYQRASAEYEAAIGGAQ